ncbi:hypothetical protein [Actinophytocola algeriensis]|uniref:ScoMcrA-like SRA domain-containing protein n=1 Tax=Actinophytocola algeriensis TaxID=1768010 RepID=A0A7W7Q1V6_9PSEU|nr:hypothetical protein [Actinophytocola algeriensis]MBB4905407.1 hypothetical protein [Actinophytocola algeriensis]MBE1472908.1 hypothetical protein [Actinophytocola algeriensis]
MTWGIAVNEVLARRAVHDEYGGSRQGGIASCAKSDNILIFTSDSGKNYGYNYDQWEGDAVFYYTGEGQKGDQVFVRGNMALRDHVQRGQHVRLFEEAARTKVRYLGEFRLSNEAPYRFEEAPDNLDDLRKVVVFRLVRVDTSQPMAQTSPEVPTVIDVPIEKNITETFSSNPTQQPTEMERREAALVERYAKSLAAENISTNRNKISFPYSKRAYYTDLFDVSRAELIEAKGSASRNHVRLAIGQLCDYSRYVPHRARAVLLPTDPGPDLVQLLNSVGIVCIFEIETNVFVRREPAVSTTPAP